MPTTDNPALRFVRELARAANPASDADLLSRYVQSRDEAAFAQLMERHGPMVFGVCRRMLGDVHAAEDAFQATFLALARGAARLHVTASVAGWLYGVAVRVAINAQRSAKREKRARGLLHSRSTTDPLAEITGRELVSAIDKELARLPKQLQAVVVLCCLEEVSQDEAARRLGCSPSTIRGRLGRGREQLRKRLARRGIAVSAGLGGILVGDANAVVPPHLFTTAVEMATTGTVTPGVAALAAGLVPSGAWKLAAVVLVVMAAAGLAAVGHGDAKPAQSPQPHPAVAEAPAVARVDRFGDPLPEGAILRLGTTRLRHADVFSLAFTPDGKLVSFGWDYAVRVWEPSTGKLIRQREFPQPAKLIREGEWKVPEYLDHRGGWLSSDARKIAVQYKGSLKIFDTESGRQLASIEQQNYYECESLALFSPDGKQLTVFDKLMGNVRICDIEANASHELGKFKYRVAVDLAYSRDGKRLALANAADGVVVWDVAAKRELLRYNPEKFGPRMVDFDSTGDVIAVGGDGPQSVRFIRVSSGKPAEGLSAPEGPSPSWVRFSPDGSRLLLGGPELRWCDPKTGKVTLTTAGPATGNPAFSPDGRLVASSGWNALQLWDVASGRLALPEDLRDEPRDQVAGVVVSPDGKQYLTHLKNSKGRSESICLWDSAGVMKSRIKVNEKTCRYPAFSPDGRYLYAVALDAMAMVRLELPSGKESARYTFAEPANDRDWIYNFAVSSDGKRVAAVIRKMNRPDAPNANRANNASDGSAYTFTTWDTATGRRLSVRESAPDLWYSFGRFSPDLQWFAYDEWSINLVGGHDMRLEFLKGWPIYSRGCAISPDGRLVAQVAERKPQFFFENRAEWLSVHVNEIATGKHVLTLPAGDCGLIAFTADSRGLIVAGPETITRWDLATQKAVLQQRAPGRFIGTYGDSFASSLAVTPDGMRAVTGHIDSTALVWDIAVPARRASTLSDEEMNAAWTALADIDAGKAFIAANTLTNAGNAVVPFLRARLPVVTIPPEKQVANLIGQLGAKEFADRQAAEKELRELGEGAAPALRAALKTELSAEQTKRIEELLAAVSPATLLQLRTVRAAAVLEWVGTKDARELLDRLAGGSAEARLTREAKAATERVR